MARARFVLYPLLFGIATLAALAVDGGDLLWVRATHRGEMLSYSVYGCTMFLALVVVAALELRFGAPAERKAEHRWVVGIGLLVASVLTHHVVEGSVKSGDYECYEAAALALDAEANPYDGTAYLYPPLVAKALAWTAARADGMQDAFWVRDHGERAWWTPEKRQQWVYFLYRAAMLAAGLACYLMCVVLATRCGFTPLQASVVCGLLFAVNAAVFRTYRYDQVNIFVLAASLGAVLTAYRRPALAGFLVALGAHIKIMPLALGLPLLLARRWVAIAASGAGLVLLAVACASWGSDWEVWGQWRSFSRHFPRSEFLRDNSLHSVLKNTLMVLFAGPDGANAAGIAGFSRKAFRFLMIGAFATIMLRVAMRERDYLRLAADRRDAVADWRFFGHSADVLMLSLVIAPLVWTHHYVMAIPLAIFALATAPVARRTLVVALIAIMLVPPSFDVYPFSYHRIAALIALLVVTWPRGQVGFVPWTPKPAAAAG